MFDLIVANYNNSSFLLEFFKSISDSTLRPAKIIFVDDCSSDNSLQLIEETKFLEGLNIQVLKNEVNIGFANSLNKAIDEISAPFFARLDPDDFVSVHRFEKQFNYLKNNPHIDLVGSNVNYVLKGNVIGQSNVPLKPSKIKDIIVSGILPLIHGSIMGSTDILADFRYNQDLVPAEDYDLFAFLVKHEYNLSNISDCLTYVNIHEDSVSNDLKLSTVNTRYDLCNHYFNFNKSIFGRYSEFYHQRFYRRYLFEKNYLLKIYFLILSAINNPQKVLNKIFDI